MLVNVCVSPTKHLKIMLARRLGLSATTTACNGSVLASGASARKAIPSVAFCRASLRYTSTTSTPPSQVIVSGIQPTGVPHIGNLLGALLNWVHLQNTADLTRTHLYFFIASLHALTVPQDAIVLRQQQYSMIASLLAIGIDPEKCTLFNQASVTAHPSMFWLLSCLTSMGRLKRMTTWKSKTNADPEEEEEAMSSISPGLLLYPVLQAGDILLYRATHVPVGEDQLQHLELTRTLARNSNRLVKSQFFPEPQPIITPSPRIYSLRDPSKKMSKSDPDSASRILLTDDPHEIRRKIKSAVTDSTRVLEFDPIARPGVANLLSICAALKGNNLTPHNIAETLNDAQPDGLGAGSGALKKLTADLLVDTIEPMRQRYIQISKDTQYIEHVLETGRKRAEEQASFALHTLQKSMGVA